MIEVVLTGIPMGKQRVRRGGAGHAYTPERTVSFEGRLALAAQAEMRGRPLMTGALSVELWSLWPVPASASKRFRAAALAGIERPTKKPDVDNVLKLIDGLNGVVWADDAQVVTASAHKIYSNRPMFAVRVCSVRGQMEVPQWVRLYSEALLEGIFG